MKKLLVILLLLFPVHGAWADKILNLVCTTETLVGKDGSKGSVSFKHTYRINLTKKLYLDWPVEITEDQIKFNIIDMETVHKAVIKRYYINRISGTYNIEISEEVTAEKALDNLHTDVVPWEGRASGECKKVSGKKKF